MQYLLGMARCEFFGESMGEGGASMEDPPAFYWHVMSTRQMLSEDLLELDWSTTAPTKLCEALAAVVIGTDEAGRLRNTNWRQLSSLMLPPDERDFDWRRGWGVLPTGGTPGAWGVTANARCPQCGQRETLRPAPRDCRVVEMYWRLVKRTFSVAVGADTHARDAFTVFLVCVGTWIVWNRLGIASLQACPQRAMSPLLWKTRSRPINHLHTEFATLGEEDFLQRWFTRFIRIENSKLQLGIVPY